MQSPFRIAVLVGAALLAAACGAEEPTTQDVPEEEPTIQDVPEAVEISIQDLFARRHQLRERSLRTLSRIEQRIDVIEKQYAWLRRQGNEKEDETLGPMRQRAAELRQGVDELDGIPAERWTRVETDLKHALVALENASVKAVVRMRKVRRDFTE